VNPHGGISAVKLVKKRSCAPNVFAANRDDIAPNNHAHANRNTGVSVAQQKIVHNHSLKDPELFNRKPGYVRKTGYSSRIYESGNTFDGVDSRTLMVSESNAEPN